MSQLLVRDLMSQPVKTVRPTSPLREVIHLMETHKIRHVAVVEEGDRLLGLISHRDVLRSQEGSLSGSASEEQTHMNRWIEARWVMTKEVRTVYPETPALEAALSLRVMSVITEPFEPQRFVSAFKRVLFDPMQEN